MNTKERQIWDLLESVPDPEVPVLSVVDLGVVRAVNIDKAPIEIVITPTYTGCPAMDMITVNIKSVLQGAGYDNFVVKQVLSPAWTTDWLSKKGRKQLKAYGIAPPVGSAENKASLMGIAKIIPCPQCDSKDTRLISQFGSTACKALYQCNSCLEPFDYFKCH